ncbi:hypothetical protein B0E53_03813 [Micromonospora sp. MH33]|nr:hypothetical protein B0E53_03813 [Micromonospora sp. MH33]
MAAIASAGRCRSAPRSQERTTRSPRLGRARTSDGGSTRPSVPVSPGQRSPSSCSQPSTRSRPPPSGSASTSRVRSRARAAVTARPPASTLAPAPPRPPSTATTRAGPPPGSSSAHSANRSTSQGSAAGRVARRHACAWSAPTSTSGAGVQRARAAAGSAASSTSVPPAAASRSSSSRRSPSAVTSRGSRRYGGSGVRGGMAASSGRTRTCRGAACRRDRRTGARPGGAVDDGGGCGQPPATESICYGRPRATGRPSEHVVRTRSFAGKGRPPSGGDGGRREVRLRGGRAEPTQRSRGVQPPRVHVLRGRRDVNSRREHKHAAMDPYTSSGVHSTQR